MSESVAETSLSHQGARDAVARPVRHVSICICTYKRPAMLKRLLEGIADQENDRSITYSIVVVDNDEQRSAESVVSEFAARSGIVVSYSVEPQQNIALARNRAVASATGDFVLFIDDDEFPSKAWLKTLVGACEQYGADGALGPVKPHFDVTPPNWVVKGGFYDRPSYPTGLVIDGKKGRTGNTLVKTSVFAAAGEEPFRPQFRTGEDQDFFHRMIDRGFRFIWCHEAIAFEVVPPIRWKRSFMLRRALLRGVSTVLQKSFGPKEIAKSVIAVPAYCIALPFALLAGQHRFMSVLIRLCDHLGKIMAVCHLSPVREAYVTE